MFQSNRIKLETLENFQSKKIWCEINKDENCVFSSVYSTIFILEMNEIQMIFVQENTWKYNIACGMLTSDRHLLFQLPPFFTAYIVIAFVIFFFIFIHLFATFLAVCVYVCVLTMNNTHSTYEISAENSTKHRIVHISLHQMCSKGKKELTSEQHKKVHKLNQKWNNNSDKNWMQKIKKFQTNIQTKSRLRVRLSKIQNGQNVCTRAKRALNEKCFNWWTFRFEHNCDPFINRVIPNATKINFEKKKKKKSNRKYCKWATNVIVMLLSSSLYIKYVFAHHFELKLSK